MEKPHSDFSFDVSEQNFETRVIAASDNVPILVDFWAPWCGPCRTLGPILEKLADEFGGRFLLARINSDENSALAQQLGVRGVPNVKAIFQRKLIDEFTGAVPESRVRAFLRKILPSPAQALHEAASAAHAEGDIDSACALLIDAIAQDPDNETVRLDLAELLIESGVLDDAAQILASVGPEPHDPLRIEQLQARLALFRNTPSESAEALEKRITAKPGDLQAKLELAQLRAAQGDLEMAFRLLLGIIRCDRNFGDDIARKTLIQFFNASNDDVLVRRYRTELAATLNR
ncbi:MAG: tetratricopeptide repeat protein [Betaproteobacteria bacterium]|nr:tetratricopeptide repeat protein [Betaproteobacteria bacterium]